MIKSKSDHMVHHVPVYGLIEQTALAVLPVLELEVER